MRRRRWPSRKRNEPASPTAATVIPATPLFVSDMATPPSPPATQASWCRLSEAANADDLISSPISCCTVESSASLDRKSTRLNSSHVEISYAVFCLKKKKEYTRVVVLVYNQTKEHPRTY